MNQYSEETEVQGELNYRHKCAFGEKFWTHTASPQVDELMSIYLNRVLKDQMYN